MKERVQTRYVEKRQKESDKMRDRVTQRVRERRLEWDWKKDSKN